MTAHTTLYHMILTRFGIGISRDSFYQVHLKMLKNGLFECLRKQTSHLFVWNVIIDKNIPSWALAELQSMKAQLPNMNLVSFYAISKARMTPFLEDLKLTIQQDLCIMTRIDDDDLLHPFFVAELQDAVQKRPFQEKYIVSFAKGLKLFAADGTCQRIDMPNTSVGLSSVFRPNDVLDIHSFNHVKAGDLQATKGAPLEVVQTTTPMWVYAIRQGSDSFVDKKRSQKTLQDFEPGFFGVGPEYLTALNAGHEDIVAKIDGLTTLKRLQVKEEILRTIRDERKKEKPKEKRIEALTAAFYAI